MLQSGAAKASDVVLWCPTKRGGVNLKKYFGRKKLEKEKDRGCTHNPACQCFAGEFKCRTAVGSGECKPSAKVRVDLGLNLRDVSVTEFAKLLDEHGGCIPVPGFCSAK